MNQDIIRIVLLGLLLLFAIAPFAGLAPLLLVIVVAGVGSIVWSLVKVLLVGDRSEETDTN